MILTEWPSNNENFHIGHYRGGANEVLPYRNITAVEDIRIALNNEGLASNVSLESRFLFDVSRVNFETIGGPNENGEQFLNIAITPVGLTHSGGYTPYLRVYHFTEAAPTPVLVDLINLNDHNDNNYFKDLGNSQDDRNPSYYWNRRLSEINSADRFIFDVGFFLNSAVASATGLTGSSSSLPSSGEATTTGLIIFGKMREFWRANLIHQFHYLRPADIFKNVFNYGESFAKTREDNNVNGEGTLLAEGKYYELYSSIDEFTPRLPGGGMSWALTNRSFECPAKYARSGFVTEENGVWSMYTHAVLPYQAGHIADRTLKFDVFMKSILSDYLKPLTFYVRDSISNEILFSHQVTGYIDAVRNQSPASAVFSVDITLPNRTLGLEIYLSADGERPLQIRDLFIEDLTGVGAIIDADEWNAYQPAIAVTMSNFEEDHIRPFYAGNPINSGRYAPWPIPEQVAFYQFDEEYDNGGGFVDTYNYGYASIDWDDEDGETEQGTSRKFLADLDLSGNVVVNGILPTNEESDSTTLQVEADTLRYNREEYVPATFTETGIDSGITEVQREGKVNIRGHVNVGSITHDTESAPTDHQLVNKQYVDGRVAGAGEAGEQVTAGDFVELVGSDLSVDRVEIQQANTMSRTVTIDASGSLAVEFVEISDGYRYSVSAYYQADGERIDVRVNRTDSSIMVRGEGFDEGDVIELRLFI